MDTDALIICNEEDESSLSETKKDPNNAFKGLRSILTDNPEIPDALRDLAPYFSADMRRKVVQMAAFGDFMIKMSDTSAFAVSSAPQEPVDPGRIYSTVKKYIPMNKRQNIDGIMELVDNIKIKMLPKPASNGLENIINTLTRINEMNKMAASAGAVKQIASAMKDPEKKNEMDMDGVVSLIGNIMGEDKMQQISSMLGKMLG